MKPTQLSIAENFYKIFLVTKSSVPEPVKFRGTAFPITATGGLLTCRHVVDIEYDKSNTQLAILDEMHSRYVPISSVIYPNDKKLDAAFIPEAFGETRKTYLSFIAQPSHITIGLEVYSFGFYLSDSEKMLRNSYFRGSITNIYEDHLASHKRLTLPYAVIEGMSGSPVLTFSNGPKIVGMLTGSQSNRIIASEVLEVMDGETKFRETVNRIVEFGIAYHAHELIKFLSDREIEGFRR